MTRGRPHRQRPAARRCRPVQGPWPSRGLTLVELLVALLVMSILAALAWQGVAGMLRAREANRASLDRTSRLATVLTQWEQDLQALHDSGAVPPLAFDGQTLRLTRRAEGGVALVTWSVRGGQWQRWTAPAHSQRAPLQQAWLASFQLLGHEPGHLTLADDAARWQLYYFRGNAWTNAQSTGDIAQPPAGAGSAAGGGTAAAEALPEAVRLVITLAGGTLTRDIALAPVMR